MLKNYIKKYYTFFFGKKLTYLEYLVDISSKQDYHRVMVDLISLIV